MLEQSNRGASPDDLLLHVDRSARRGLRDQLEHELRRAIQSGRLAAGARLPPSRALARDLGVARSVVVGAYAQLAADGYVAARQGSGTVVRAGTRAVAPRPPAAPAQPTARFLGGLPDPALFPRREWQRHYRAALQALPDAELAYPGPAGARALRAALADYLGRVRGVATHPDEIVVTNGFTQALALLCRALVDAGVARLAVEDPCFGFHRRTIEVAGLRPVPIRVDADGLDVEQLRASGARAVLVAPAHSYPLGAVLSAERRAALVAWARERDAIVIEDDYDAEFRYDRAPIGALQGLAPEHVVYAGCASKTLTPALRLGWVAAPARLVGALLHQKAFDDLGSPLLEQLALARLIESGGFTRHLRRVRPLYERRRDAALDAIVQRLPGAIPRGVAAGLHVYVELPGTCDEAALVERARERGVVVEGAAWHWADPASAPPALVLGYGSGTEAATRRGLAVLGEAYESLRTRSHPAR